MCWHPQLFCFKTLICDLGSYCVVPSQENQIFCFILFLFFISRFTSLEYFLLGHSLLADLLSLSHIPLGERSGPSPAACRASKD